MMTPPTQLLLARLCWSHGHEFGFSVFVTGLEACMGSENTTAVSLTWRH